ncbi:MAG: YceD family protein [Methylococcaceae bacterium]
MLDRLPEYIDPLQLADKRGALKGQIALNSLDRLAEMLHNDTGNVFVDLFFSREGRLIKIEGQIEANLELKCQNCLQALEWAVKTAVRLGVVTSIDQANRLPEDFEPLLIVGGEKIILKNLIEDELILALPAYPKHLHNCFVHNFENNTVDLLPNDDQSSAKNPFSILAKLKKSGDL